MNWEGAALHPAEHAQSVARHGQSGQELILTWCEKEQRAIGTERVEPHLGDCGPAVQVARHVHVGQKRSGCQSLSTSSVFRRLAGRLCQLTAGQTVEDERMGARNNVFEEDSKARRALAGGRGVLSGWAASRAHTILPRSAARCTWQLSPWNDGIADGRERKVRRGGVIKTTISAEQNRTGRTHLFPELVSMLLPLQMLLERVHSPV